MRQVFLVCSVVLLSGCASSEADRFNHQMERDRLIEQANAQRQVCEESLRGAWMCSGPSKRANERFPWLHCGCVDNQTVLER